MDFRDLLGDVLPGTSTPKSKGPEEKGVQMRSKTIEGVKYVRLEDVVKLLTINGVLPKIAAKFKGALP